jgi:hypothetical protein
MALKGTILKKEITDKILATFEGSFLYNDGKEIRIPGIEDGQELQVKVALTCAKTNVSPDGENALPGEDTPVVATVSNVSQAPVEATQEEKDNIKKMMEVLGL